MLRFRNMMAFLVLVFPATAPVAAQEPIRFARTPDISPDGKLVAFSYLGDIWTVETIGGTARRLTTHVAHDVNPVFSPDGSKIAFSSNRHGSYDVFVMSSRGGKATRLTFDSADDLVSGWSPDGKHVLFTSTRSTAYPLNFQVYTVPVTGGRVRQVTASGGKEAVVSPKGDRIAYVRGGGASWYRKGYRGSSNDDIWVCDADGTHNQRVTDFNGQDSSPMWGPDGKYLYYVSECWGTPANIVRQELGSKNKAQLVTFHKDDSVRLARISKDGEWIVYECGGDLWVISTREGHRPRKLAIEALADDKTNPERTLTFTKDVTEFAPSPDELNIAFVVRGELFLIPRTGGKAVRLTDDPHYDHGIAWAPNGRHILFASDRKGHEDLYLLESDPPGRKLGRATKFKVKQLTDSPEAKEGANFSPDGKRISFLRDGKLWTMKPDGTDQKIIVNQTQVIDYEWSPDSKWLAFARLDGSFSTEIYIIPATGGQAKNVTRHATFNADITWSARGMKLAFVSNRRRSQNMYVMSLQKPAAKGAPTSSDIDWEDVHRRVHPVAAVPASSGAISPDGTRVAFRSAGAGGFDLWVATADGRSLTRVTTGNLFPRQIRWSKNGLFVYFLDRTGTIRLATVGFSPQHLPVPFLAKMTVRRDEEFAEMFDQSWRALRDNFYDAKLHGANWNEVRSKYRPLLKHVAMKEDLYILITLMLGELNASHLGISGFLGFPEETTADLGLLFDETHKGPGLKIAEVLKRGPADKRGITLKKGEYVLTIDGVRLTEQTNLSQQLNGKANETVVLEVADSPTVDPKKSYAVRRVELTAAGRSRVYDLMYDRWVEHNAKTVAKLSNGKLGYIHIPSMDEEGLDSFVRSLYSDNFDKEAIVLDVRFNGGGFAHDQVLNYLGGKDHTIFHSRFGSQGAVLRSHDRKWTRPLVLLINNRSFSDAEIFPHAFRTLGLGKLVGQPTGGMVIGTTSIELIDGSTFRIPRTGVFTVEGVNMEKEGVKPDVLVEPHPDQLAKGEDAQLTKAVEVLRRDVLAWKKKRDELVQKGNGKKTNPPSEGPGPRSKPVVGPMKK
jgi:tricorn protease